MQDPITADRPRSQQRRLYSHSSSKASNGDCKKVLEISKGPQLLAYIIQTLEKRKRKKLL